MSAEITRSRFFAHFREREPKEQTLENHLVGVSQLAASFAAKLGLRECGELIGLLHDLGKYSAEFQNYLRSAVGQMNQDEDEEWVDAKALKGKVDHSTAGGQYVWHALSKKGGLELRVAQILSLCIVSHHSGLIDCLDADGQDIFGRRMGKVREKTHLDESREAMDVFIRARSTELLDGAALISGPRELIGRILRRNEQLPIIQQHQLGLAVRFLFSCLIDADRIDTADFEQDKVRRNRPSGDYPTWATLIARLEDHLKGMDVKYRIDSLRRDISDHCRDAAQRPGGVYTLTVPTGGGKTLASLRFALHHAAVRKVQNRSESNDCGMDRIIYVIPFTSIIDQNAQIVRSILDPDAGDSGRSKIVLEHHSSITPEQQTWREKMLCENWDAPVVFTTMVQFLEALFGAGTRGARRMHQLANSVLIFDEIQSLPIKCVHLFNNAVNFLVENCNCTVVLCSATQPLLDKVSAKHGNIRLAAEPELMPDRQRLFDELKRVEVRDGRKSVGWTHSEVAELAQSEKERAGSSLVIVNTKNAARKIFDASGSNHDKDEYVHLSTDMCPAHRKHELAKIRRRLSEGLPVLCVSTQLIEAGVDVDFGVVIRCLAGIDSIAQAAGRCNRNGKLDLGVVHVINLADEDLNKLLDIQIGAEKAKRVLDDYRTDTARYRNNLFGREAIDEYYEYYFYERQNDMSYAVSAKEIGHDDTLLNLLSCNGSSVSAYQKGKTDAVADRLLYQSFMTAAKAFKTIDAPTQAVVVPYGEKGKDLIGRLHGAFDVELEFDLLREAQQYSVNIFPHVLYKLRAAGAVKEAKPETRILTLDSRYYSPQFGVATEPVALMENLNG